MSRGDGGGAEDVCRRGGRCRRWGSECPRGNVGAGGVDGEGIFDGFGSESWSAAEYFRERGEREY